MESYRRPLHRACTGSARILLVDDEPEVRDILSEFLVEHGFAVRTASNADEAVLEAKRWTPKAVLLDLMIPDTGGLEILERIIQVNPGIVVIFISGQSSALEVLERAGLRGAGTFPKPLNLPELLETLTQAGVAPGGERGPSDRTDGTEDAERVRSVLVVDDEPDVRAVLAEFIRVKGYDVREADGGEDALIQVEESCPDLVLLDLGMPGLSGIETLRRLKAENPQAGVIVVSANQDQELAQKALATGAIDYVPKPVDFGYLEAVLAAARRADQITAQ